MKSRNTYRDQRNTLSIEGALYHRLLEKLDESGDGEKPTASRVYRRLGYRHAKLGLKIKSDAHLDREIIVATRNLSQGGLSILHSSFMYTGTRVVVDLIATNNTVSSRRGFVKRCEHCGGRVHEIGIQFEDEIRLKDFLHPDPSLLLYSRESIDPERMDSRLMVLTQNTDFSSVLREYMSETSLVYTFAKSREEALEKCSDIDIAVCHLDQDFMQTADTVRAMRSQGFKNPIILVGKPESAIDTHIANTCGADMIIPWPSPKLTVLCSIGEFVFNDWTPETLQTIRSCISLETKRAISTELAKVGVTLDQQIRTQCPEGIRLATTQIRSLVPSLGYDAIASTIDTLTTGQTIETELDSIAPELTEIANFCREFANIAA